MIRVVKRIIFVLGLVAPSLLVAQPIEPTEQPDTTTVENSTLQGGRGGETAGVGGGNG